MFLSNGPTIKECDISLKADSINTIWKFLHVVRHSVTRLELSNIRFLDIGCGSLEAEDLFYPHTCMTLHEAGVKVVGIDIGANDEEPFESHVADINDPHALDFLDRESFDVVNHSALISEGNGLPSPSLVKMKNYVGDTQIALQLLLCAERMLKEGGVYFQEYQPWIKEDGKLSEINFYDLGHRVNSK